MPGPVSNNTSRPSAKPSAPASTNPQRPADSYRGPVDQGHVSASALALQIAVTSAPKPERRESWFRRHFRRAKKPKLSEQQQLMNQFEEQRKMRARYVELYTKEAQSAHAEAKSYMAQGDRESAALAYGRYKTNNRWAQVNKLYLHQIQRQEGELANQEAFEHLRNVQTAGIERVDALIATNGSAVEHSDFVQGSLDNLDTESDRMVGNIDVMMKNEAESLAMLEAELVAELGPRVALPAIEAPQTAASQANKPQVLPPAVN